MKKIKRWLKEVFDPSEIQDLDIAVLTSAFNDTTVRAIWFVRMFDELRSMNLEVDKRLLSGSEGSYIDLCARRKAFQDVLEMVLSARRQVVQDERPNPRVPVSVNLDRVTV